MLEVQRTRRSRRRSDSKVETVQQANQEIDNWIERLREDIEFSLQNAADEVEKYLSKRESIETVVDDRESEAQELINAVKEEEEEYLKSGGDEDWVPDYLYNNLWDAVEVLAEVLVWRNKENVAQDVIIRKQKDLIEDVKGMRRSEEMLKEAKELVKDTEKEKLETFEDLMKNRLASTEENLEQKIENRVSQRQSEIQQLEDRLDRMERENDLVEAVQALAVELRQVSGQRRVQAALTAEQLSTLREADVPMQNVVSDGGPGQSGAATDGDHRTTIPADQPAANGGGAAAGQQVDGASNGGQDGGDAASDGSERSESTDEEGEDGDEGGPDDEAGGGDPDLDAREERVLELVEDGMQSPDAIRDELNEWDIEIPARQIETLLEHDLVDPSDFSDPMQIYLDKEGVDIDEGDEDDDSERSESGDGGGG